MELILIIGAVVVTIIYVIGVIHFYLNAVMAISLAQAFGYPPPPHWQIILVVLLWPIMLPYEIVMDYLEK